MLTVQNESQIIILYCCCYYCCYCCCYYYYCCCYYCLLGGGGTESGKNHVLIMDEVDGMAGNEDRGGVQVWV